MTKKLSDEALNQVVGGVERVVNTGDDRNAAIRSIPGLDTEITALLPNGTIVNTTGQYMLADGRDWAEIDYPVKGWIKASIIGYEK